MFAGKRLAVRILGLGERGARMVPVVAAAVEGFAAAEWSAQVEGAEGGDDVRAAGRKIRRWCDHDGVDVVLTVGRAGHQASDFAPEMTASLIERSLPGIEERMYLAPPRHPLDLLFRGRAGLRGSTLVVNLPDRPGRARAIVRFLCPVVWHVLEKARGGDRECAWPRAPR